MKKIGKKLSKFMKLFLAFGLLFNNLSSLSVVFADELDNNGQAVVDNQQTDNTDNNDQQQVGEETVPGDAKGDEEETQSVEPASTEEPVVEDELVYTATLNEDNQIVIKYNKAADLSEESKFVIVEDMKYVNETTYGGERTEVELTEEVRNALASEAGYVFDSVILADNLYEGTYSANVAINEDQKIIEKVIEAEGEGIEFKLYTPDEVEVVPFEDEEPPRYYIDEGNASFIVTARLLNGGISPNDVITVGGEEVMASELFEEGAILEEPLEGYLYGEFDYNVALDYTMGEQVKSASKTFKIMYGQYIYTTWNLNESVKNVGLEGKYYFYGDYPENAFYAVGEEGLEDILKDFVGDSEIITYEINGNNVTLTDGRVTVTYEEAELNEYGTIAARLESDSTEVSSGDTFTVKFIVNIDDYYINGVSGLVKYDETLLKLVGIETDESIAKYEFEGGNQDGRFLYAGYRTLLSEFEVDDEGNATESPKDYVLLTLTFEALKAGEANVSIEEARFYDSYFYFVSEEDISTSVVINEATDNTLSSLKVAGQDIQLEKDKLEYEITVGNEVTVADVEAMLANSAATYKVDVPSELVVGENTITITVTAENGDIREYTVKVTREAATEEEPTAEVVTPVSYEEYNTNNREPEVIVTPGDKDDDKKDAEEEKGENNISRIVIIILILLAIAGLIYLIFKDEDDEETKKANKEIDKLKKEDNEKVENRKPNNQKKVKKKGR